MPFTYVNTRLNSDINEVFTGTTSDVYIVPSGITPTTPSYIPSHGLSINGGLYTPDEQSGLFSGGDSDDGATAAIRCSGTVFTAGTINEISMLLTVNGAVERVSFQYTTDSGDTAADILTGLVAVLNAGYGGSSPAAGSRIISTNLTNTAAQIAAAMVVEFGASYTFAVASSAITMTLADGSDGNNFQVSTQIHNSAPSPLISLTAAGTPAYPGVLHMGATRDFTLNITPNTIDILADNFDVPFGTLLTGSTPQGSFNIVQNTSQRFMRVASGTGAQTFNDNSNLLLLSGRKRLERAGVILVTPSRIQSGQYDALVLYDCVFTGGLQLNRARAADNPIAAQFRPIARTSQGDPYGYVFGFREL